MIMSFINHKVLIGFLLFFAVLRGQENLTSFIEPRLAINYSLSNLYSHNWAIANRYVMYQSNEIKFNARQFFLEHFSNFKIRENQSLGLGVSYRLSQIFEEERVNEFRITEQYNLFYRPHIVRFGHRFRAEQRITSLQSFHRFRYRFTIDLPLNGQNSDTGKSYFIGYTETLLNVGEGLAPIYDKRFSANFGWLLTKVTKLQIGSEYRLLYSSGIVQNILLWRTSVILSL